MNPLTSPTTDLIVIVTASQMTFCPIRTIGVRLARETGTAPISALHARPYIRAFFVSGAIDSAGILRAKGAVTTASIGAVLVGHA
jgi:hypothetical protein